MNLGIGLGLTNYLRVPTVALDPDAAISELFRTGTPGVYYEGAWYDPSDSTTVFQDAAGRTPATAGDPVGLILDKSKGLTLGPELVTLSLPASYTNYTGYIILGTSKVVGSWYKYQFTLSSVTSGGVSIHPERAGIYDSADGTYSYIINSTSTALRFYANNFTGTIDSVTVKELPGNHATQTTSAARPVLQSSGGLYYLDFDGVDDVLVAASVTAGTFKSVMFAAGDKAGNPTRMVGMGTTGNYAGQYNNSAIWYLPNELSGRIGGTWLNGADAVASFLSDEVNVSGWVNGALGINNAPTTALTTNGLRLGSSSASYSECDIYGLIVVDRVVSTPEREATETYLATKSGVTL